MQWLNLSCRTLYIECTHGSCDEFVGVQHKICMKTQFAHVSADIVSKFNAFELVSFKMTHFSRQIFQCQIPSLIKCLFYYYCVGFCVLYTCLLVWTEGFSHETIGCELQSYAIFDKSKIHFHFWSVDLWRSTKTTFCAHSFENLPKNKGNESKSDYHFKSHWKSKWAEKFIFWLEYWFSMNEWFISISELNCLLHFHRNK